jgi:lysozyme family protein
MKRFILLAAAVCIFFSPTMPPPSLPGTSFTTAAFAADIKPALIHTFGNEGGYQADPHDSGNYACGVLKGTKFGIAAASYPHEDIKNLTLERAGAIYARDFWGASRCGEWKSQIIANEYFDYAVNLGQGTAARIIQRAINYAGWPLAPIPVDGKIGPATVARLNAVDQDLLYVNLIGLTHNRYVQVVDANPAKARYMKTWTRRIKSNVLRSVHEYEARRK